MKTDELINSLTQDLQPTPGRYGIRFWLLVWLMLSTAYVLSVTLLLGPLRPGVVDQLITLPRFSLELAVGFLAMVSAAAYCLRGSIPGALGASGIWLQRVSLGLWLALLASAFLSPVAEPSMLGKRDGCIWESFLLSTPPLIFLLRIAFRRYPLDRSTTVIVGAIAAGMIPAITMQVACMYDPLHGLLFHVLPVFYLAIGAFAVSIAWRWFQGRRAAAT